MINNYSYMIPRDSLELPQAPENHNWEVKNIITNTEKETTYHVEVRLVNPDGIAVITNIETWNPKVEEFKDFVVGITPIVVINLRNYLYFSSLNWERDNLPLNGKETSELGINSTSRVWTFDKIKSNENEKKR